MAKPKQKLVKALSVEDLLGKGYFPKELPPPFNTTSLAQLLGPKPSALPAEFSDSSGYHKTSRMAHHSLVRMGGIRRRLGIPNPIHYYRQSDFIVQNWTSVVADASKSMLSMSVPTTMKPDRAISPACEMSDRVNRRATIRANSKVILRADVSLFYPSIYTHSIPWAIHTKVIAKANRKNPAMYGNDLDRHTQSLQDGQTMGIPIGPDTSLLIAEIVLSAVDEVLASSKFRNGFRYFDDYEFGFESVGQAENALACLEATLAHYELTLNAAKSRIKELPLDIELPWVSQIRTFPFRQAGEPAQEHDLVAYFNLVFDLMTRFPDDGVLNFAVPRLNSVDIKPENWDLLQNLLSQCCRIEPATIPFVVDQLVHYMGEGLGLKKQLWKRTFNAVITERLPLGYTSESAWAIWGLIVVEQKLDAKSCTAIDATDDGVIALLGLDAMAKGLTGSRAFPSLSKFCEPQELYGPQWMICYEASHKKWLAAPSGTDPLSTDPCFKYLSSNSVSFYDEQATHPKPSRTAPSGVSDTSP